MIALADFTGDGAVDVLGVMNAFDVSNTVEAFTYTRKAVPVLLANANDGQGTLLAPISLPSVSLSLNCEACSHLDGNAFPAPFQTFWPSHLTNTLWCLQASASPRIASLRSTWTAMATWISWTATPRSTSTTAPAPFQSAPRPSSADLASPTATTWRWPMSTATAISIC